MFRDNDFHHSALQAIYPFFCLSCSTVGSFYCIVHLCLFFSSFRFLVKIYCIFSILFPRSWVIFTTIILNSFSGRLPISTSFSCFSGVLSCPFTYLSTFSSWLTFCNVVFVLAAMALWFFLLLLSAPLMEKLRGFYKLSSDWSFFFVFGHGVSFFFFSFGGFHRTPVDGFSTANCSFGALPGGDEHMSFCSAILNQKPEECLFLGKEFH